MSGWLIVIAAVIVILMLSGPESDDGGNVSGRKRIPGAAGAEVLRTAEEEE